MGVYLSATVFAPVIATEPAWRYKAGLGAVVGAVSLTWIHEPPQPDGAASGVFAMAVPKRKVSPMKRGFRRSTDALKTPTFSEDKEDGELKRPHHINLKSGRYRGRQVLPSKDD